MPTVSYPGGEVHQDGPAVKGAPSMPEEQAADFAALLKASEEAPAGDVPAEPLPPDPAEEWAMLPAIFGSVLGMVLPEVKAAYTPEACRAWGAAMVPVAEKYGWDSSELLGRFGPEIGLLCASVPLAMATVGAVRKKRGELLEAQGLRQPPAVPAAVPAAPAGGAGQGVTFGGVGQAA